MGYNPWGHKESDRTEQPSTEKSWLLQYLIHCAENYFLTYLIFLRLYGSLRIETMFLFIFQLLGTKSYLIHISFVKMKVAQSCPTLCHPMDYTVHGILQARILEWVAVPFSKGSSQPRDWTQVSHIIDRFFTSWVILCDIKYWVLNKIFWIYLIVVTIINRNYF